MKQLFLITFIFMSNIVAACLVSSLAQAQNDSNIRYTDASQLTLIGKIAPTPNPYHRVDTARYPALTATEKSLVRHSSGLALVFRTNSPEIWIKTGYISRAASNFICSAGYDLYIKSDNQWLYAASGVGSNATAPLRLIANMDASEKECLLYLPTYSELASVELGVTENATIEALPNPFRHKIVMFGSSFTHGASASRAGMTLPIQIERNTGLYICNLGVSGNSSLQPAFADILADSDADAFIIDGFSNPSVRLIEERLLPFIERIRAVRPNVPLIFLQTIYRESENFDLAARRNTEGKREAAERMMTKAMENYRDIYFINIPNLTGTDHQTSADGTHPSDLGYYRWVQNIQPEIVRILATYQIQ